MVELIEVILIALFIEAVVDALKPIWTPGEERFTAAEYASMALGVLLAVSCRINMLGYIILFETPVWVEYLFYVMTGIAIGRGTNFVYDLWSRMKEWQGKELISEALPLEKTLPYMPEDDLDALNVSSWSLEVLIEFAKINGFALPDTMPVDDQMAKEHLIAAMFGKETSADEIESETNGIESEIE